jgi:starvation-inducible DNA-binding protein
MPKLHPSQQDLPIAAREQLAALLNLRLAQAIDLQLQAKQAHWNVRGENFIALHQLFDSLADHAAEAVDLIAERITALASVAEGTVQVVAGRSTLPAYPLDASGGRAHLQALQAALALTGKDLRQAIDQATTLGDANTADLFTELSRQADKDLWFVEAHLSE